MDYSKLLLLILSITIVTTYGCSETTAPTDPEPTPDRPTTESFNELHDDALNTRIQTQSFNAEEGISFTSERGVQLDIPAECLALNGDSVNGQVSLEYIELFDKSSMVVTNKPTMGVTPDGDKKMLVSGGEFSVQVYQNGEALESSCGSSQLEIPGSITGGIDTAMTKWTGSIDSTGNLAWEEDNSNGTNSVVTVDSTGVPNSNYTMLLDDYGWTNVDRFYNDPRPKTTIKVETPQGYGPDNSAIYLSFDGEGNALAQLDIFNNGLFSDGQIPLGLEMHVIFVSEENDQWRYGIKGVTVANNDVYSFTLSETTTGSEQDITDAIDALP